MERSGTGKEKGNADLKTWGVIDEYKAIVKGKVKSEDRRYRKRRQVDKNGEKNSVRKGKEANSCLKDLKKGVEIRMH